MGLTIKALRYIFCFGFIFVPSHAFKREPKKKFHAVDS